MDNASFETQVWVSDEEDKLSFYVGGNDSQQNSAQCDKVDLEECGKAPTFGKRRRSTQEVAKKIWMEKVWRKTSPFLKKVGAP